VRGECVVQILGRWVFHRKARSLAQNPLTDNSLERYDFEQVTNSVINGVWEWVGPRFAVW
jgi:hypothetical protein